MKSFPIPLEIPEISVRARASLAIALAMLAAGPARAYEHRTSTPSFGAQFGYGRIVAGDTYHIKNWPIGGGQTTTRDVDLADVYDEFGPSAHVTVRFVLDPTHALGFGFDDLRYKRQAGYDAAQREALARWVKYTTFHADYYLYFHRRARLGYYVAPLVGLQQRELRFKGSEVQTQEYRLLYGTTAGFEYFFRRTLSLDLGVKVFSLRGGNGTTVVVQPAVGFQLYVI